MPEATRTVTKREAATCQLETAIKPFLENRDLISAYTLCCAADGILEGIYKNKRDEILQGQRDQSVPLEDLRFSWGEELEMRIKPEHQKEVFRLLNAQQNFFKHADRNPESTQQFPDWQLTGLKAVATVIDYSLVFRETTPAMRLFLTLYAILEPGLFAKGKLLPDASTVMRDVETMSKGFSPEVLTAAGYAALRRASPGLFRSSGCSP